MKNKADYLGFSPRDNVEDMIVSLIEKARISIWVMVFKIDSKAIIQALCKASNRGVDVKVITDLKNYNDKNPTMDQLKTLRIPTKVYKKLSDEIMHHKITLVDAEQVIIGTGNYLQDHFANNYESLLVLNSIQVVDGAKSVFWDIWNSQSIEAEVGKKQYVRCSASRRLRRAIFSAKGRLAILLVSVFFNIFLFYSLF